MAPAVLLADPPAHVEGAERASDAVPEHGGDGVDAAVVHVIKRIGEIVAGNGGCAWRGE